MKTRKKTAILNWLLRRLHWSTRHQRLSLFWVAALVSLALPWLPNFSTGAHKTCTVNSIHDGDTMRLTCDGEQVKVRLYCIDAPEMGQWPWGKVSRDYLRAITPKQVRLVAHDRDRYGRTVGEVITTDEAQENLNLAMIWSGQAAVYPRYCNDGQYYQAEQEARKIGSGIWGSKGLHQSPWSWRR